VNDFSIDEIEKKVNLIESYLNEGVLISTFIGGFSEFLLSNNTDESKVIMIIKLIKKSCFSGKFKRNYSTLGHPSNIVLHNGNIIISIKRHVIYFNFKEKKDISILVENEKLLEDLRNDIKHFSLVKTLDSIYDNTPILKRNKNLNSLLKKLNK
jgi:hypothetical protein